MKLKILFLLNCESPKYIAKLFFPQYIMPIRTETHVCFLKHLKKFLIFPHNDLFNMGLVVTKPVFWVSDKVRFKPACSAIEARYNIEISLIASLDIILSKKRITKALIRLHGCAGWSAPLLFPNLQRKVFSRRGPYGVDFFTDVPYT